MPGNRTIINSSVFAYSNKPKGFFANGELKFISGNNGGVSRTVLVHGDGYAIVRVAFPTDIQENDTFNVWAGCDKNGNTCATRFVQSTTNNNLIIDGGFNDDTKWTTPTGWSISGSKATHGDSSTAFALTPNPQLTTIKANTFYDISLIYSNVSDTNWYLDIFYVSIGGITFYVNNKNPTNYSKSIITKTNAGLLIFPCIQYPADESGGAVYFDFSIDDLSVTLGGTSPGNYANFFGFENVPKPEIML